MSTTQRKRGITIYRASDAVRLEDTDFMTAPEFPEGSTRAISPDTGANVAAGSDIRVLNRDAGGFSLVHVWFKGNYPLPRHSHNADCMYYVISGMALMGSQTLRAGDSFFVPAGAPYQYTAGPEGVEVLEIRHGVDQFDIKLGQDPGQFQKLVAAAVANRQDWVDSEVSPTFAANAS
jgi:mannose-6-phosphate isomerase-like protein (cupin superfamily)